MKKRVVKYSYFVAVLALISYGFSDKKTTRIHSDFIVSESVLVDLPQPSPSHFDPRFLRVPFYGKSFVAFKERVGFKESGGRYHVVNSFGYMGKYQFNAPTLKLLGIQDTTTFLKTPVLQEIAFEKNLSRNKWILRKEIAKFNGTVIDGLLITESGILAAAHLAGPGNVKKFLHSNGQARFSDAFGTSLRKYLKDFGGYDISKIEANRKARI
ncbi:MAG: hypothetical protein KKC03_06500 [Bacteroidetes bacterium]|nr:hypothetical protein [Bacteroidota bacterium]